MWDLHAPSYQLLMLYNSDDTHRVVKEVESKYTNEQQQLRKPCFFNWEALAKDASQHLSSRIDGIVTKTSLDLDELSREVSY